MHLFKVWCHIICGELQTQKSSMVKALMTRTGRQSRASRTQHHQNDDALRAKWVRMYPFLHCRIREPLENRTLTACDYLVPFPGCGRGATKYCGAYSLSDFIVCWCMVFRQVLFVNSNNYFLAVELFHFCIWRNLPSTVSKTSHASQTTCTGVGRQ